ncbi:hypothetical protein D9M70_479000 [compost metagenome]
MRRRAGEYSELKVMALGSTPPRPIPVKKSSAVSTSIFGARAQARVPTDRISKLSSNTSLRP